MPTDEAFWLKLGAISQAAAAIGTFLAVALSLWLSTRHNKPKVLLKVGERLILGSTRAADENLLMFLVANAGSRPAKITHFGWETGWLDWGPHFLKKQYAVQTFGGTSFTLQVPFELHVGLDGACYAQMDNVLNWAREKKGPPFFTRDVPLLGRKRTRVRAYAMTADGHKFSITPERSFVDQMVAVEVAKATDAEASDRTTGVTPT